MIGMISVKHTADRPNFPLRPLAVFVGSSMTLGITDVPPTREGIAVTGVSLQIENTVEAVRSVAASQCGDVWTATIPASHFAVAGTVEMGVTISALGTDENGLARSWIVGRGNLAILPADGVLPPGETSITVHYREEVPATPLEGDLCEGDDGWQIYTGEAWSVISPNMENYYTKSETDTAIQNATSGLYTKPADGIPKTDLAAAVQASLEKADAALPKTDVIDPVTATETGKAADALKVKERTALTTLNPSAWSFSPDWWEVLDSSIRFDRVVYNEGYWVAQGHPDGIAEVIVLSQVQGAEYAQTVTFPTTIYLNSPVTATRTVERGFVLGNPADNTNPNKDKPVAKQEDLETAEAAIAAKYTKPNDGIPKTDLASGVQSSLDKADAALPGTGGTMTGGLTTPDLTVGVRYAGATVGKNSVAAGGENEASGDYSFANGANSHAKGHFSHAEGVNTEATGGYQHAEGSWNYPHTVLSGTAEQIAAGTALWMLGFGTSSADKKNALETMRNGKTFVYGVGGFDGTNPTGSGVVDLAAFLNALPSAGDLRYTIGAANTIATASTDDSDPQNPINYGAVTLADRTANVVAVTAALDELRITFPAAVSGKVRDTYLRVEVGTGSAALTAPAIVPIAPTGETITIEAADGTLPTLADGSASSKGITLLYFTETKAGTFLLQGKTIEEVA